MVTAMLILAPLLGLLPQAVLAAVVIIYSVGLIQPAEFAAIRMMTRVGAWYCKGTSSWPFVSR